MTEYKDMTLVEIEEFTYLSSPEIGAHGTRLWDCESGRSWEMPDGDTALFLASSRAIVLELCRRLRAANLEEIK